MLGRVILPIERKVLKTLGAEFVSMDFIDDLLINIEEEVSRDNFQPDLVIGIKNSGVYPAKKLSEKLCTDYDSVEVNRDKYSFGGITMNDRLVLNRLLGIYTSKDPFLRESTKLSKIEGKVLLVDDDCGSGKTFELAKEHLFEKGAEEIRTVCVFNYEERAKSDYVGLKVEKLNSWMWGSKRLPWADVSPHYEDYQRKLSFLK